jgi:hypothetical protein
MDIGRMDTPEVSLHAVDTARRANNHIAEMVEKLDSIVEDERRIGFFCECGCFGSTEVTLDDFRAAGGAWIEGHR